MVFKDLYAFNKELLMKLKWGIISNIEALWVQVLLSKYNCGLDDVLRVNMHMHELLCVG